MRGDAMLLDGFFMCRCGVSLIAGPIVGWVFHMKLLHILVTMRFSQYRCSRDGEKPGIALDDTRVRGALVRTEAVAIH